MNLKLTKKEEKAIEQLEKIAKTWPKSLWLYSASGSLCVMRYKPDGEIAMVYNGGLSSTGEKSGAGFDSDYKITTIDIPNDGGDW